MSTESSLSSVMETYPTKAYHLGQFIFVPTYHTKGKYAAPGGKEFSEDVLLKAGAKPTIEMLWKRPESY
jgi:hypothetical protein